MNFRQVTICAAAALLAAAAGCRAHAPGGGDAGTGYAMTLSVTAGVLSPNITGLPTSWAAGDSTWTATDDTGAAR